MEKRRLTPEEEQKIREEVRKELEKIVKNREENKDDDKKDIEKELFEIELEKKRIRNEEIEKFYTERGYKKYVNHYGIVEWLTPEEYEKRMARKEKARKKRKSSKKKHNLTIFVLMTIIIILVLVLLLLFVKYVNSG